MLGSLTSLTGGGGLTGGSSGPSTATSTNKTESTTRNSSDFIGGSINFGSNNGLPMWALVGAGLVVGYWVFFRKK